MVNSRGLEQKLKEKSRNFELIKNGRKTKKDKRVAFGFQVGESNIFTFFLHFLMKKIFVR